MSCRVPGLREFLLALLAATVMVLASAGSAWASDDVGLPLKDPASLTAIPPGFTTNAKQAIAVAKTSPVLQEFHRHVHPLRIQPTVWAGYQWFIAFYHDGRVVAEAMISSRGRLISAFTGPQARALYTQGNYSPLFDSPWVIGPFSLLFLAPFVVRRRRGGHTIALDGVLVAALLISYGLFDNAHLEPAVWMVYPPLLLLIGRLLWAGFGRRGASPGGGGAPALARLSPWLLGGAVLALVAARAVLSLVNFEVTDVGYASVVGAARIAHGHTLYFNSTGHGDTYGPVAYLAYLPFELLFPWRGGWGYVVSAHIATVVFDLVTVGGLVLLGRRLRPGAAGLRVGLLLAWGWAACPLTLLPMIMHTNDGLVAMLSVLALLALGSPATRGALLGLAAAAKFTPAALLPLLATGRRRSLRGTLVCGGCFAVVALGSIALYLPPGGVSEFWAHTIGYQLHRADVFSPWALHPSLHPLATVLEIAAVLIALAVAVRPRERDLATIAALAGAVTIAVQLPAVHWFYFYADWFVPFVLVGALVPRMLAETVIVHPPAEADAAARAAASAARPRRAVSVPVGV